MVLHTLLGERIKGLQLGEAEREHIVEQVAIGVAEEPSQFCFRYYFTARAFNPQLLATASRRCDTLDGKRAPAALLFV